MSFILYQQIKKLSTFIFFNCGKLVNGFATIMVLRFYLIDIKNQNARQRLANVYDFLLVKKSDLFVIINENYFPSLAAST